MLESKRDQDGPRRLGSVYLCHYIECEKRKFPARCAPALPIFAILVTPKKKKRRRRKENKKESCFHSTRQLDPSLLPFFLDKSYDA